MSWRACLTKLFKVVAVLAIAITATFAQTSVSVAPASKNVLPTSTVTLSFNISNVANMVAYHFYVDYDSTILHYESASPGVFLQGLFFPKKTGPHTLDIANAAILGGTANGSGTAFTLQFTTIGLGTTTMTIDSVDLRAAPNTRISPVTIYSGSVTVSNPTAVYVNCTYSSGNSGAHDFGFDAFNTVGNGVAAVNTGGTVNIAAATYNESVTIGKKLTLTGAGDPTIQNLTVNTPAVTLGANIQVSGILTLTSGVVTTGTNKITITNDQPGGVVITDGSIAGEICRTIQAGNTGDYLFTNRFTLVKPGPSQPLTTMCFVSYPGIYPPNASPGIAVHRYYTISPSPATFEADILRLEYLAAENEHGISSLSMRLFRNSGSVWVNMSGVGESSLGHTYVTSFVIDQWSPWAIGSEDTPLPIQLASFTGRVINGVDVRLDWRTLSEVNNYGFEVQKSADGTDFETIANSFVSGNGTTTNPHEYFFLERNATIGHWQYRLKQIDLDGSVHYTEPIHVDVLTDVKQNSIPTEFALEQNYPNPFNPSTTISFAVPRPAHVALEVFNTLGEKIVTLAAEEFGAGRHSVEWNAGNLSSGVYLVRLTAAGFVNTKKVLLNK